jgi:hypothetical protein
MIWGSYFAALRRLQSENLAMSHCMAIDPPTQPAGTNGKVHTTSKS